MYKKINYLCYLTMTALGLYLSAYQNAMPEITNEYNLAGWVSGLLVSLHFIASFLFPFVLGALADRIGRQPVITVCFGLIIIGMGFITLTGNIFLCSFGIFIIGGGFCVVESSMSSLLSEFNPDNETKVMNLSQMYFCLGAVAGPLAGTLLNKIFNNWRAVYIFIIVMFAVCVVLLALIKLPIPIVRASKEKSYIGSVLRSKYFMLLLLAMFIYVGIEEGAAFWTGRFISGSLGVGMVSAYFLSSYWLGMALGRLIASKIKKSLIPITTAGLFISVFFFVGMFVFQSAIPILILFFFVGFGISPAWPLLMTQAVKSCPETPDTAAGGIMSAGAMGAAVVPFLLGVCADASSIIASFGILLGLLIVLAFLQFAVGRRRS